MDRVERIQSLVRSGAIRLTEHAIAELAADGFTMEDLLAAFDTAVILEDYPYDRRGASCLVSGNASDGRALHAVCAVWTPDVLVITVYEPKPPKWVTPSQRGAP